MTSAVELLNQRRLQKARAELDAQRQVAALLKAKGEPGPPGPPGPQGPKGDKPAHEWKGTALRFENPDGTWGEAVDLRGPKGARGSSGGSGGVAVDRAPISPSFTYTDGLVTAVAYADGSAKALTWTDGRLTRLDFSRPSARTVRKDFSYNPDGTLSGVSQTTL